MRLGFHVSIAGGLARSIDEAKARHCDTIQIFSRNPRGWKFGPLDDADIRNFQSLVRDSGIAPVFIHMPYLPNLCARDPGLYQRSERSLLEDLIRCERVGADFLIMHIGSAPDPEKGRPRMAAGIRDALKTAANRTVLLLENTAGAGHALGYRFEEIRTILNLIDIPSRTGVVLDIAHAFAAGYDFRTRKAVTESLKQFDRWIGFKNLRLVHFNDSRAAFGSRRDRHWHIGKGEIGKGMKYVINDPNLKNVPFIMETPRTGLKEDLMNLRTAKKLLARKKP
jgi:deoxyribonuclease-4